MDVRKKNNIRISMYENKNGKMKRTKEMLENQLSSMLVDTIALDCLFALLSWL